MDDNQKLREENIRLKSIVENVRLPLILLDEDMRILYSSPAIESWGEKKPSDVEGCYCLKMALGMEPCETCVAKIALESGEVQSFEFSLGNYQNKDLHSKYIAIPTKDTDGNKRVLVILTDNKGNTHAKKNWVDSTRSSSKGEMSSVLAHGLRNSLTSMKMILQLLYESSTLNNTDKDSIYVALHSVLNMEKVVADFTKFCERRKPEFRKHDVNLIVNETINFSRYKLDVDNIQISLETQNDHEPADISETQFREALINLIFNAGEAIGKSGKLHIRTYAYNGKFKKNKNRSEYSKITTNLKDLNPVENNTPAVVVEIEDNGNGISKKRLSRIFDPFFTTKVNGMGLGLTMVKRMIEDHHGHITVESGSWGSRFILVIPRRSKQENNS